MPPISMTFSLMATTRHRLKAIRFGRRGERAAKTPVSGFWVLPVSLPGFGGCHRSRQSLSRPTRRGGEAGTSKVGFRPGAGRPYDWQHMPFRARRPVRGGAVALTPIATPGCSEAAFRHTGPQGVSHFATRPGAGLTENCLIVAEKGQEPALRPCHPLVGTLGALTRSVRIAIPIWQQRVSPVLDAASRLLLVTRRRGRKAERTELGLCPLPAEDLVRRVAAQQVDVVLCAALSAPLLRALERCGIRVRPHLCGEVEAVLRAFGRGRLGDPALRMPGCRGDPHCHGRTTGARARDSTRRPTTLSKGQEHPTQHAT